MDHEMKLFLGRGWSFPPSFDRINDSNQMVPGLTDIEESIHIILGTTPGERIMQPEFGCHIKRAVFERVNLNLIAEINHIIGNALLNFEPRIKFINAEVLEEASIEGLIHIRINYTIIITNTRHNIVFPFYLSQGTNVSF
jgi:phage baseplate assembly protein W